MQVGVPFLKQLLLHYRAKLNKEICRGMGEPGIMIGPACGESERALRH
jgi:hypothetical protein